MNTGEKRTLARLVVSMAVYLILVYMASRIGGAGAPTLVKWLLALLPVVPCLYALVVLTRHVLAMDELKRLIHLQAAAFALGFTVVASLCAASLRAFAGVGSVDLIWAVPVIAVGWMLGLLAGSRRYA